MLNIKYELKGLIDKYKDDIIRRMKDPNVLSDSEADMHTEFIHRAGKGDVEARNYVMNKVKDHLMTLLEKQDRTLLRQIIVNHIKTIQNKEYEIVDIENIDFHKEEAFITYYQLMNDYGSKYQLRLLNTDIEQIDEIEILAMEIYKIEYGLSKIEELLYTSINNIEVHGTRKIRIETNKGLWFSIKDYHFETDDEITRIADRLYSQEGNGQITEEDCEKEGRLLNGARLTIALKPGSAENCIFIKKFDSFNVSEEEMIKNGTVSQGMIDDLRILAKGRANAVIIGGVNTGKSTFSKIYVGLFPKHYKIGLIDSGKDTDLIDLYPDRDIVTLYETDKYNQNDQFKLQLRTNRHILAIGEARSYEVEQMLKGMTRANSGSFCNLHLTNPNIVINTIAQMCLESGLPQDINVLRERAAEAIDIIIRLRHFEDTGERKVDYVGECEVDYNNTNRPFKIKPIYRWNENTQVVEKVSDYVMSDDLKEKLKYYGCSDEEIERLRGAV